MEKSVRCTANVAHSVKEIISEVDFGKNFEFFRDISLDDSRFNQVKKSDREKTERNSKNSIQDMSPYSADVLDPFALRRQLSFFQILRSILLSVFLLPVRVVLMVVTLSTACVIGQLLLIGLPKEQAQHEEPLSGWRRRWAKPFISKMARLTFFFGGWYWTPQKGRRATVKEAPILLVMPHSSFLDTVMVIALDCPGMVVKDSTERIPLIGKLIKYTQPLIVKTEDPGSRRNIAETIRKRVTSGKDWEQLLLFPEGGCGNRKALLQFKHGGFSPGVPVQPVFIRYKNKLDTITWSWDGPGLLEQIWLTLTQFCIFSELEFLPVYNPSEEERLNPKLFSDNVQKYVSGCTNTPISHFSLEDAPYIKKARHLQLPATAPLVKLLRLRKSIGRQDMDPVAELKLLKERQKSSLRRRGNAEDLAAYIGVKRCSEALKDFFRIMNQHKEDSINLQVYDAGLSLLRTDLKVKVKLKEAFKSFGEKSEAEHLEAILLLWKGVPSSLSQLKCLNSLEKTEKELCII